MQVQRKFVADGGDAVRYHVVRAGQQQHEGEHQTEGHLAVPENSRVPAKDIHKSHKHLFRTGRLFQKIVCVPRTEGDPISQSHGRFGTHCSMSSASGQMCSAKRPKNPRKAYFVEIKGSPRARPSGTATGISKDWRYVQETPRRPNFELSHMNFMSSVLASFVSV